MTQVQKSEIEKISKEFASQFKDTIGEISSSGWMIVDPLSGYLNFCGFVNVLHQLPATENSPMVLIMTFEDGTQFIPAGSDIQHKDATDWLWIDND